MTKPRPEATRSLGTAVLIHGCWGNPDDWMFVRRALDVAGVGVETPDLPSHRSPQASMDDDVQLVREVIRGSTPPVVCAGWSYGGAIMSLAVVGEPSVTHAVFVDSLPFDPSDVEGASWIEADPHVVVHADGTYDIDSDWYETDVIRTPRTCGMSAGGLCPGGGSRSRDHRGVHPSDRLSPEA